MNKIINLIFRDIKKDKSVYISLSIVLILSLIFGLFFITILTNDDKVLLSNHINEYFSFIKTETLKYNLLNNVINNSIGIIILWILGFSIIGLPVIISILFYKGFTLAFTITSLIYNYKLNGIIISFIYIFPHLILYLLFYFIASFYSFKMCTYLIMNIIGKSKININIIKKYLFVLVISLVFIFIGCIYETYLLPHIIKLFLTF